MAVQRSRRETTMDLAEEVPSSFVRETERAAQRFHDAYGFCACGAAKDELVKLFGNDWAHPSAVGHIQRCERCGGDKHVGDGHQECLVCGHHAGVDADGRVYECNLELSVAPDRVLFCTREKS
jgi:hypothetical protein